MREGSPPAVARRLGPVAALLAALLVAAAPAGAATKVVGFDDLTAGTTVSDQYETSHGVTFLPDDPGFQPVVQSVPAQARSDPNVANISTCTGGDCEFWTPRTTGRFTTAARSVALYAGYLQPMGDAQVTLLARDVSENVVAQAGPITISAGQPFNSGFLKATSPSTTPDIASFELYASNAGFDINEFMGFDDLTIEFPETASPPDFSLSAGGPISLRQGQSLNVPVNVNRLNSNGNVSLSASGLPNAVSASFSPNPVTGTGRLSTMTLTAGAEAPFYDFYKTITITGTPTAGAGSQVRTTTKQIKVVENCDFDVRFDYVAAHGPCIRREGARWVVVNRQVKINGLLFAPTSGIDSKLYLDPGGRRIQSEGLWAVAIPGSPDPDIPIYAGPIDWYIGEPPGGGPRTVLDYPIPSGKLLKGLPMTNASVALTRSGQAQIKATVKLAFWPFNYFGALTAGAVFTTDNDHGSDFTGLDFMLDRVAALGIELRDAYFKWRSSSSWSGGAKVRLPFAFPYGIDAGVGIKNGDLDFLRGGVNNLNVAIGPAIFLQGIAFQVQLNPRKLRGEIGLSGGPSILGKSALTVTGGLEATFSDPFIVQADGRAKLADKWELGEAFMRYSSDGLFELGGQLDWDFGPAYVDGRIFGWVDGGDAFDFEGRVEGCISVKYLPDPCGRASLLVSNIGIAGCIDVTVVAGGLGYEWGGDFDLFWGCDLSSYRPVMGSAHASATPRRFRLPRGLRAAVFAVDGVGDAPSVTFSGPKGESITVSRTSPSVRKGNLSALQTENNTTYLVIRRPAAGTWTITPADGSAPIRSIREARGVPRPKIKARVSGRGRRRTLHWRLRRISGQRVIFAESGRGVRNAIVKTRARRGKRRFRPALGPGGRRKLVAIVEQNGVPRTTLTVGSYRAPPRPRPGKPRRLRLRRKGSALRVSWRPPRRGFRHAVYLKVGDGRRLLRIVSARRRSVAVRGIRRYGARVSVRGLTKANGRGPAARVSIKPGPPPRPAAGRWVMTRAFNYTGKVTFRVARRGRSVSPLRLTRGRGADSDCRSGEIRVAGKRKVSLARRAGLTMWVVGRSSRRSYDGVSARRVSLRHRGKRRRGTLKLIFKSRRRGTGELRFSGCRLYFEIRKR